MLAPGPGVAVNRALSTTKIRKPRRQMTWGIMKTLLYRTLFFIVGAAALASPSSYAVDSWAKSYSLYKHPLLGTSFCAATETQDCKYSPFQTSIYYYMHRSDYQTDIQKAMLEFERLGTFKFTKITVAQRDLNVAATIDFTVDTTYRRYGTPKHDVIATARTKRSAYASISHGHRVCEINSKKRMLDGLSSKKRVAVYVHEIGHCLGLDHYGYMKSEIMYPELLCDQYNASTPCTLTTKAKGAIWDGYFTTPYGIKWWIDDPDWIQDVHDHHNKKERAWICSILGYICYYL